MKRGAGNQLTKERGEVEDEEEQQQQQSQQPRQPIGERK